MRAGCLHGFGQSQIELGRWRRDLLQQIDCLPDGAEGGLQFPNRRGCGQRACLTDGLPGLFDLRMARKRRRPGFELRQLRDNALPDGRRIDFEFDDGIEIIPRNAVRKGNRVAGGGISLQGNTRTTGQDAGSLKLSSVGGFSDGEGFGIRWAQDMQVGGGAVRCIGGDAPAFFFEPLMVFGDEGLAGIRVFDRFGDWRDPLVQFNQAFPNIAFPEGAIGLFG